MIELPKNFKATDPISKQSFVFFECPGNEAKIYCGLEGASGVYIEDAKRARALIDFGAQQQKALMESELDKAHEKGYQVGLEEARTSDKKQGVCLVCGAPGACCMRCA